MYKLNKLKKYYSEIVKSDLTYNIFNFKKNNVNLEVIFDINVTPFKLHLIKSKPCMLLSFDVLEGFIIDLNIAKLDYKYLCKMLELKYDPNSPLRPREFFAELDSKIPTEITGKIISISTMSKIYKTEEIDKPYYKGMTDWSKNGISERNYTKENREKTRLLYPKIFNTIKDKNVSVLYTADESYKDKY